MNQPGVLGPGQFTNKRHERLLRIRPHIAVSQALGLLVALTLAGLRGDVS